VADLVIARRHQLATRIALRSLLPSLPKRSRTAVSIFCRSPIAKRA
jgi:hypothetical protein